MLVHCERDPVQGLGAHHAAEAAGVVRVPDGLQDLGTKTSQNILQLVTFMIMQTCTSRFRYISIAFLLFLNNSNHYSPCFYFYMFTLSYEWIYIYI